MDETGSAIGRNDPLDEYINTRWKGQLEWFEGRAAYNQRLYLRMRRIMLVCSWLTPIAIFLLLLLPPRFRDWLSIVPLVLSTAAIACYQWEDQHGYGPNWAKFRLISERLKRQREFAIQRAGPYADLDSDAVRRRFVQATEGLIEGTDVNYFTLMVDPEPKPHGEL
jgi:hypothetical protein